MFALFHLNLFQFFYAFGLGLMFGYVYMRTSQLRYSIVMHMIINFNGSVLAPWVLSQVDLEALATTDTTDAAAAQALLTQNGAGMMLVSGYGLLLIAPVDCGRGAADHQASHVRVLYHARAAAEGAWAGRPPSATRAW